MDDLEGRSQLKTLFTVIQVVCLGKKSSFVLQDKEKGDRCLSASREHQEAAFS